MEHPSESTPEDLLIRDPLTGTYTRGLLQPRLSEELARAEREISPLVVCLFCVPFTPSTQTVLCDAAQWTYQCIRSSDLLFRADTDTFVLVLPATTREQAMVVCQRILEHFSQGQLNIHLGVSSYPEDGDSADDLLEVAGQRQNAAQQQNIGYVTHENDEQPHVYFNPRLKSIERDAQFTVLEKFLHNLRHHPRGLLQVAAERGSGRSFFMRHAALLAQQHDYLVLPLSMPDQAISPEPQVLQSLLHEVEQAGKAGLLVLYDSHHPITPEVLNAIFEQPSPHSLGVVADGTVVSDQLLVDRLELLPFSRTGLHRWVRDVFHWDAPQSFIDWLLERSEGLPGQAEKQLKTLLDSGRLKYTGGSWQADLEES